MTVDTTPKRVLCGCPFVRKCLFWTSQTWTTQYSEVSRPSEFSAALQWTTAFVDEEVVIRHRYAQYRMQRGHDAYKTFQTVISNAKTFQTKTNKKITRGVIVFEILSPKPRTGHRSIAGNVRHKMEQRRNFLQCCRTVAADGERSLSGCCSRASFNCWGEYTRLWLESDSWDEGNIFFFCCTFVPFLINRQANN